MSDRRRAAADNALASVRAEDLEPGADVEALLTAWADGKVSDRQMDATERAILAGESIERALYWSSDEHEHDGPSSGRRGEPAATPTDARHQAGASSRQLRTLDVGVDEARLIELPGRTSWTDLRSQTINTPEREADVARERALMDSQDRSKRRTA